MNKLKENITNLFGQSGQKWLDTLPCRVESLVREWHLKDILPVSNMTYNFVAKATHPEYGPVVMKVSYNQEMISDEIKALNFFDGNGMVKLLDTLPEYHAILIHQALPGDSLKDLYRRDTDETMRIYARVVRQLASTSQQNKREFKPIREWLLALDRSDPESFPDELLETSIRLKKQLLDTSQNEIVLHGDLHHDNILSDGTRHIAIDPKGIVGEIEFEVAAFDFLKRYELDCSDVVDRLESRINALSQHLSLDAHRLTQWVFIRCMLGAAWDLEAGSNPAGFIRCAESADRLLETISYSTPTTP